MDRISLFAWVLSAAIVFGFTGIASAQGEEADVPADVPYVDEEGNVDYEMAKDYADLVDSWVDDDGTEWEVWLDESGGHMWAEYLTLDGLLGDENLLVPSWIKLVRSDLDDVFYNLSGSGDGDIGYVGTCGTACYKWSVCAYDSGNFTPIDIDSIQAKAVSDEDYCDANYIGTYDFPNGSSFAWFEADDYSCGTSGSSWYLLYEGSPDGDDDYGFHENMVRWHVHVPGSGGLYVYVYYNGGCITK